MTVSLIGLEEFTQGVQTLYLLDQWELKHKLIAEEMPSASAQFLPPIYKTTRTNSTDFESLGNLIPPQISLSSHFSSLSYFSVIIFIKVCFFFVYFQESPQYQFSLAWDSELWATFSSYTGSDNVPHRTYRVAEEKTPVPCWENTCQGKRRHSTNNVASWFFPRLPSSTWR